MKRKSWVWMEQATDGGDGGAGGGTGGEAAGAPANTSLLDDLPGAGSDDGGQDEGQGGQQDGDKGAADSPEARALKAAEKDTRRPKHVPAKFWNAEKGEVNFEAWGTSTKSLESRMKDVGLPPDSATGYTYEAPQQFKELGVDLMPDQMKAVQEEAHKAGLSQKQFQWALDQFFSNMDTFVKHGERYDRATTLKALEAHYKTPEAIQENVKSAYDVFSAFADDEEMKDIYRVCNDPIAVRVLAKIKREMNEDSGARTEAALPAESIDALMAKGSPYWDAKHPQHNEVKAKVAAHYAGKTKAEQRKRVA